MAHEPGVNMLGNMLQARIGFSSQCEMWRN